MNTDSPENMAEPRNGRKNSEEEQMSNGETQKEVITVGEDNEIIVTRNSIESDMHDVDFSQEDVSNEIFEVLNETVDRCCQLVEFGCSVKVQDVKRSEKNESENASKHETEYLEMDTVFVPQYEFHSPHQITHATQEFVTADASKNCFLKGCKWSPDGTCLLTSSDDNCLRLFDLPMCLYEQHILKDSIALLPELSAVLKTKLGGTIYDFAWFPYMTSLDPETCCFASTSSIAPVQLWDAFTGELRATYRGYDQYDEVTAATSIAFSPAGDKLYCGYYNCIKIFSSDRPGRDYDNLNIKEVSGQTGIVSCIAGNPCMPNIFAVGTYQKTVGLYSDDGTAICLLKGQTQGLTYIQFSPDGCLLYTGGRKDMDILCWDLRNLGQVLYTLKRTVATNQRIYFDITQDGKYLVSGSTDGKVSVWDTSCASENSISTLKPTDQWTSHNDCTNGVSIHRHLPLLATSSGQRHMSTITEVDSSISTKENCVKLWWIGPKECKL